MNEVVRTITSESGRFRAEIIRRAMGGYQIELTRKIEERVPEYNHFFEGWIPCPQSVTLTDTIESATYLAAEILLVCGHPVAVLETPCS